MTKVNKFVDERNTRGWHQDSIYQQIVDAGEDPFAKENLLKYHKGAGGILFENYSWYVIYNQWPYPRTKHHFVIIVQRYKESILELDDIELTDLKAAVQWLSQTYGIIGGGFGMRTGNTLRSGSSVKRLHAHYIEPDLDHPEYSRESRVNFVIGGNKTKPETPSNENRS